MAMVPPVYALLSADAAVTALVPASRIRGQGYAGETPVAPYITWQTVSGVPANYIAGRPGIDAFRVQIDIWANDATSAKQIATAVRDALELNAHCVSIMGESFEADTKLFRYSYDWAFHTPR